MQLYAYIIKLNKLKRRNKTFGYFIETSPKTPHIQVG